MIDLREEEEEDDDDENTLYHIISYHIESHDNQRVVVSPNLNSIFIFLHHSAPHRKPTT
jgi:hypothetical protein